MRVLLDTHILVWWLYEQQRLSDEAVDRLDRAEQIFVSSASIWEIAIKVRLGKLKADVDEVIEQVESKSLHALPVTFAHARHVAGLRLHHNDPFDRLLIAQAITESLHLITADEQLQQYSQLVMCI
jgi:PIN domain nuclease of toxin-antitoxin system